MTLYLALMLALGGAGPLTGISTSDAAVTIETAPVTRPSETPGQSGESLEEARTRLLGDEGLPWWVRERSSRPASLQAIRPGGLRRAMAENRREAALKSVLGVHRWRRLDEARFNMSVDALGFTRDPEHDRYRVHELEDVLQSNFLKLTREAAEHALGVDALVDRYLTRFRPARMGHDGERQATEDFSLRVSPQVSFGDNPRLGVKLRARGLTSPIWSRVYLRLNHRMAEGDSGLALAFDHPTLDGDFYLEYATDDERHGEYVRFSVRFSY